VSQLRIGDRVGTRSNGTGTAIDLRDGKVLVSFYASGEQLWFDPAQVTKSTISKGRSTTP